MRLHGLVGELGAGQRAHALQSQIAQIGLPVLQELAQLVAGSNQQGGLAATDEMQGLAAAFLGNTHQHFNTTGREPMAAGLVLGQEVQKGKRSVTCLQTRAQRLSDVADLS